MATRANPKPGSKITIVNASPKRPVPTSPPKVTPTVTPGKVPINGIGSKASPTVNPIKGASNVPKVKVTDTSMAESAKIQGDSQKAPLKGQADNKDFVQTFEVDSTREPIKDVNSVADTKEGVQIGSCFKCCGIFFSLLLFVCALGYIAITALCLMDKKGKEVYFAEDPQGTEYTLQTALIKRMENPTWTMKTEDGGYIYRAFERGTLDSDSYWKDYDIFLYIAGTAGLTGILWFIMGIIEMRKFAGSRWNYACCSFTMCFLTLLLFIVGNGYVAYRVYNFYMDMEQYWDTCDCYDFMVDYHKSVIWYTFAVAVMLLVALFHFFASMAFRCKRPPLAVTPQI